MPLNLSKSAGIPLILSGMIPIIKADLNHPEKEIKKYNDYKKFFKDSSLDKNINLYYVYRNYCLNKDKAIFKKYGVRYDVTVIGKEIVGKEAPHTIGHIHKQNSQGLRQNEIYQVISGSALFLLHDTKNKLFWVIKRTKGQKIIIPGHCAHIIVNNLPQKPLVVANIFTNKKNSSDYSFFKKTSGPAWYPIRNGTKINFLKNSSYKKSVSLRLVKKINLPFGISSNRSLYLDFIKNPLKFSFLAQPTVINTKNIFV